MITLTTFEDISDEEFMGMLGALTEREQLVLMLLRGVNGATPMSHSDVGSELGITTPEIRKIEDKALETIERMNSGWREESLIIVHGDGTMERF